MPNDQGVHPRHGGITDTFSQTTGGRMGRHLVRHPVRHLVRRVVSLLAVAALLTLVVAAPALADDPVGSRDCQLGTNKCIDAVVKEMTRRFDPLAKACDHDAIFSLAYLRVTQAYRQAVEDPQYFSDNALVNHEDALFASLYFTADSNYRAGLRGQVPQAWQIAFDAAEHRQVSGAGNMLLGMNAHITRDLPIVLDQIGLGSKADYDKINDLTAPLYGPTLDEIARRFDPSVRQLSGGDVPGTSLDDDLVIQTGIAYREDAWQKAEQLHSATTPAARALVLAEIESDAATRAQALLTTFGYKPGESSAPRDAFCGTHWNR